MQRAILGCFLVLLGCLWLVSACTPSDTQQIAAGQEVYIANCAHCHQVGGQGYVQVYPRLAGNPIVTLHDPSPVIEIVMNGRGSMPAYRDELTLQERAQVISYIRNAWGNQASTVTSSQAQ